MNLRTRFLAGAALFAAALSDGSAWAQGFRGGPNSYRPAPAPGPPSRSGGTIVSGNVGGVGVHIHVQPTRPAPPPVSPAPPRHPGGNFRPVPPVQPGVVVRPSVPNLGGGVVVTRPGGAARPLPGRTGDFWDLDRPGTRPAPVVRPTPAGPVVTWRPRPDNRPWQPGGNSNDWRPDRVPGWARRPGAVTVGNQWNSVAVRPGLRNWGQAHPERMARWSRWGGNVRHNWQWNSYHGTWFRGDWWNTHFRPGTYGFNNWHYAWCFGRHPWQYWWTTPTYAGLTGWFAWNAPQTVWSQPCYYDYGQGGNVYTVNNVVYVDGQPIGSSADNVAALATLASVAPPGSQADLENADWMALGTFAVSTTESDARPAWIVQLAVNQRGVVSGVLYNTTNDTAQNVLGQVDRYTQRVAFRVGDSDLVLETGLYNLTLREAPVLAHFGLDRTDSWLLVRLDAPAY